MTVHPIPPFYCEDSKVLILGSFPSVKSREEMFFYAHPQNRFWAVLASVFEDKEPKTKEEKKSFLKAHNIALWDVVASCDIIGSADVSIKNVKPNNIKDVLCKSNIKAIFTNGKTAWNFYNKYIKDEIKKEAVCLPSTSPANAAYSKERLTAEWSKVKSDM